MRDITSPDTPESGRHKCSTSFRYESFVDDRKKFPPLDFLLQKYFERYIPFWEGAVSHCHDIDDLRRVMERRVPKQVADYFLGAAGDESTMNDNSLAFRAWDLNPNYAGDKDLTKIDMRTTVLGHPISMPVLGAPVGSLRTLWPKGEAVAASAICGAGTISILSTLTGTSLEEVIAAAQGPCWFQLYLVGGQDIAFKAIKRAKKAGYSALVLTIDTPVAGNRMRDLSNGSKDLMSGTFLEKAPYIPRIATKHNSWAAGFYADGGLMQFLNIIRNDGTPMPYANIGEQLKSSAVKWQHINAIRNVWDGPIVIKGIHNLNDALLAGKNGAAAIVISNHGGRQLNGVLPTLKILEEIADPFKERYPHVEIYMDGGIRSGQDVIKAVALGAKAVLIGRAYAYGLGAGGKAGVVRAFELVRKDIEHTMIQLERPSIDSIDRSCLVPNPLFPYPYHAINVFS